ncbi:MAG TPA: glycosyltransferase family 4 protein [Terriglobales bacterium]|nr:glycosyltransferase family 4 protein [Terriglobales bacterium]
MRILLVNAFHYLRGGVERTYLDESRWLAAAGHEIAHLATRDPRNLPSPTSARFAPAADYGEGAPLGRQLAQLPRALWSRPAEAAAAAIVSEFRPEVAHVHAPSRYLTPSILRPFERAGVPVVMTLHDFKPWCTNRILFAHGAPCERCKGGRHWHSFAIGCVQGSRAKSAVGMVEAYLHAAIGAYRAVRLWIAPSSFVLEKAAAFGVDRARLRLLPHGVDAGAGITHPGGAAPAAAPAPRTATGEPIEPATPYVLYAGRLSTEKGVRLLPALAMRLAPVPLVVVGEGPLGEWLASQIASLPNLKVLGYRPEASLTALRRGAAVVVVPSLFYEHFCYAAAEALLESRPVVASRIGAIPEIVEHERTGLLAPPGDPHALAEAVKRALEDPEAARWAEAGRARVLDLGAPGRHIERLIAIYREAMGSGPAR